MKMESMLADLEYLREVNARRKTYFVYRGPKHYLVSSFKSRNAGYFMVVSRESVDALARRFAGRTVTNPELSANKVIARQFSERFQILNALYALVAEGRAKINRGLTSKTSGRIFFDIKRPRV